MEQIIPKKRFGQNFLKDLNIAKKIVGSIKSDLNKPIIEIGPGTGVLTQFLLERRNVKPIVIEIDKQAIEVLKNKFNDKIIIIENDFLKIDLRDYLKEGGVVIGNIPYNISSQILFKILEFREIVEEAILMVQKEVGERIASEHGRKSYGILSVLLQTYFNVEYLFSVKPTVFYPQPKVMSSVIRLTSKSDLIIDYDEILFNKIVKLSFNKRRKILRNALKDLIPETFDHPFMQLRAEQLKPQDFIELTKIVSNLKIE